MPVLELPVASDIVRTKDPKTNIVLRVFEMKGDDLAQLVDEASVRLFALNIRGYLRETVVNENMKVTLRKAPQNFLYFNNGVTFVCDNATFEDPDANDRLTLINPQIINGQQTTRVLHEVDRKIAGRAMVVVRVIVIPRGSTGRRQEALISNVVQATNWQNSIKLSDLQSNDLQQVKIERGFRQLGTYHYSRKKQPKRDVKAEVGKGVRIIGRDDLAKAVAGCRIESSPLRGIEALFSEYYDDIFNNYPMKYYLACYWLWLRVRSYASRELDSVERKRGIWLGLYRLNQELEPIIKKRYDIFIRLSERATEFPQLAALLGVLADTMIASCARFYRTYKGVEGYGATPTNFFKTKDLDDLFSTFWVDPKNASLRIKFEKALTRFERAFAEAELA